MSMQSTGQGGRQRSQPVQSASITVCICFRAPTIASTGQAAMQSVQPMHRASSITATRRGPSTPHAGSSGAYGRPVRAASVRIPASPPGGQRLIAASPAAIARA